MYLATAFSAWLRVCQETGQISSDLMVLKNVSTILSSPFWFVAEGAMAGLVIGFAATRFGGEGPETVAQTAAVR